MPGGRRSVVCWVLVGVSRGLHPLPGGFVDTCDSRGAVVPALSSEQGLFCENVGLGNIGSALQTAPIPPHSWLFALTSLPSCLLSSPTTPYLSFCKMALQKNKWLFLKHKSSFRPFCSQSGKLPPPKVAENTGKINVLSSVRVPGPSPNHSSSHLQVQRRSL